MQSLLNRASYCVGLAALACFSLMNGSVFAEMGTTPAEISIPKGATIDYTKFSETALELLMVPAIAALGIGVAIWVMRRGWGFFRSFAR